MLLCKNSCFVSTDSRYTKQLICVIAAELMVRILLKKALCSVECFYFKPLATFEFWQFFSPFCISLMAALILWQLIRSHLYSFCSILTPWGNITLIESPNTQTCCSVHSPVASKRYVKGSICALSLLLPHWFQSLSFYYICCYSCKKKTPHCSDSTLWNIIHIYI